MAREVATGEALAVHLRPGELLVVTTPDGRQGGDLSFPGFDQALTRNANGWRKFGRPYLVYSAEPGMELLDGEAEAFLRVGEMRCAGNLDLMLPGCWSEIYEDGRPGCRDLISEALGIARGDLAGMLSFFVGSEVAEDHYDGLVGAPIEPGDFVSFVALRETQVAVSACPDMGIEGWSPGRLEVDVRPGGLSPMHEEGI